MLDNKEEFTIKIKDTAKGSTKLLETWLKLETVISTISSRFLGNFNIDEVINTTLRDIGILSGVSRSYLFSISDDNNYISNTHEWNEENIDPRVHKLQNLEINKFPWLINRLRNGKIIHVSNTISLPEKAFTTKEFLELQNIKSVLIYPIFVKSKLFGFIGFDTVNFDREWKDTDFSLLRITSQIIGNALERDKFEAVLKESEEHHRLILENINDLVAIINSNYKFEYLNEETLFKLLGYRNEDVLGCSCLDFIHKDEVEQLTNAFKKKSKAIETFSELRFKHKSGEWICFECRGQSFVDRDNTQKWLIVSRDITERKLIEERYKNLFENSPNAIVLIDLKGEILDCNSTTNKIFGYGRELLKGKNINDLNDLFLLDIRHYFKRIFQASFIKNFPKPIEVQVKDQQNKPIWVKIQASLIKQHGSSLIQLIFQDITEKKKVELFEDKFKEELEEEVKLRTKELNVALEQQKLFLDQIVKSSQFKTEFMGTMSHELRTPLNAIIGFADLLLEGVYGELSNDQKEFIVDIKSSAEHQFEMIKQILNITKIESGQLSLNIQKFSLNSLLEQIKSTLRPLYKKKNLKLKIKGIDEELVMFADPIRLKEILLNLFSNAIKFSIDGTIRLKMTQNYYDWIFKIVDNGIGIAQKDFSLIFKEFKRVDSPYVRSVSGTGLGLSLTKRLIELHGGEINFTSSLGVGTIFTFNIPKKFERI
ncbi:MAG: sensor histidine kinase [Promethearchaeota archaeon]